MLTNSWSRRPQTLRPFLSLRVGYALKSSRCHSHPRLRNDLARPLSTRDVPVSASSKSRLGPSRKVLNKNLLLCRIGPVSYTSSALQSKYAPIKDDSHPSLFYHLFDDEDAMAVGGPAFALSFLDDRPRDGISDPTILGWLPALSSEEAEAENGGSGLNDFHENEDFLPILHRILKEKLSEDEVWTNGAVQTQSGWMHIFDQRNPPPLGRIPDPDDILASVRVEDGRILTETYQPMPSYRLCTTHGVCQLTDTLMDRLKYALKDLRRKQEEKRL